MGQDGCERSGILIVNTLFWNFLWILLRSGVLGDGCCVSFTLVGWSETERREVALLGSTTTEATNQTEGTLLVSLMARGEI